MNRFAYRDQSRSVAIWLFLCAAMVFAMVVIGGVTRLTGSGLSITEWKPIMGAIPPMSDAAWVDAFQKYKAIPQYAQINAGMSLSEFQGIFWWEWLHRLLGRLIGVVFALPLAVFLVLRKIPRRLIARCVILLALARRRIPLIEVRPNEVKKSLTGNGHAGKAQMQLGVQRHFGLAEPPSPADVADAIAIAVCAARRRATVEAIEGTTGGVSDHGAEVSDRDGVIH